MGVRLSGWDRQGDSKKKYIYILVIGVLSIIALVATPTLLRKSKTSPKRQAILYMAVTGSVLLALLVWGIISYIIKKVTGVNPKGRSKTWFTTFFWLSHVIYYAAVGYLSPSLFIVALLLGFVWEFSECYNLNW